MIVKYEYFSTECSSGTSLYVVFQNRHLIDSKVGKNAVGIRSLCFFNCIFGLINTEAYKPDKQLADCWETLVFLAGWTCPVLPFQAA